MNHKELRRDEFYELEKGIESGKIKTMDDVEELILKYHLDDLEDKKTELKEIEEKEITGSADAEYIKGKRTVMCYEIEQMEKIIRNGKQNKDIAKSLV